MKKEQIVISIERAFRELSVPSEEEIAAAGGWEQSDIQRDFYEFLATPPSKVDLSSDNVKALLEWHGDSLPGFSPKGFHFFLQIYLLYSIEFPNSDVADYVVYHLADIDVSRRYWEARYPLFSTKQKRSICDFLRYMALRGDFVNFRKIIDEGIDIWCA